MASTYEIYALCAGGRTVDWSTRMYLYPIGETAASAFFLWVLQGAGGPIVVDTGFTHRLAQAKNPKLSAAGFRTREELLETAGVDAASVSTVILTHLHWDHFDVEGIFPRAVFWVQRAELEFWTGYGARERWHQRFVSDCFAEDLAALQSSGRLRVIDGNTDVADGVSLELVGGHSPGMQIVVVRTSRGPFVIANDALTTYRNLRDWMPPAVHVGDLRKCIEAMERIRTLTDGDESRICPGHDGEVWKRFPEVKPGVYRLA